MNHSFHCHLAKSFLWYKNWHKHPHYQHAHWSIFIIISIFVFSFIAGSTKNIYLEENYAQAQSGLTLGISGTQFTINGSPRFLLFVSYFDAMNASDATLNSDFARLQSLGFNGVRIFTNWNPPGNPGQLMDSNGNLRSGMLNRLINIIQKAQNYNLIVDVSSTLDTVSGLTVAEHMNGLVAMAQGLRPYRNVYFDIQNEADHSGNTCGSVRMCANEAKQIRDAIKAVDPQRILSVSLVSDSGAEASYVIAGGMDFHPTHGPFGTLSGTATFMAGEKADVPGMPIHMQEPDRCRGNPCGYTANEFFTSAREAKCAGAAGWNFHTRAGYDLSNNTMFNSWLDPNVENAVATGLSGALAPSCTGGNPPPGPAPTPGPPYGSQGNCPSGYIMYGEANASIADWAQSGYFCDDDAPFGVTGETYPLSGFLYCSGSATAFITTSGPCNCRPRDISGCKYDPNQPFNTFTNNPGWSFSNGQPINVNILAENSNCSVPKPVTLANGNVTIGGYHNKLAGGGYMCIVGTDLSLIPQGPKRYLNFVAPDQAPIGTTIILAGSVLTDEVEFIDSAGNSTKTKGILNFDATEVRVIVPTTLPAGAYTVRIYTPQPTQALPFEVIPGFASRGPTGTELPIINSITPLSINQGGTIEISGEFLSTNVQFVDLNGWITYAGGVVTPDFTKVTVTLSPGMPTGVYNVGVINDNGLTMAQDVITVTDSQTPPNPFVQSIPPPSASAFSDLISSAFDYAVGFVGIAVFVMIMWAGFLWITSGANPGNIETAKRYIRNAILGAILLFSAYVILYTINPELVGGALNFPSIKVSPGPSTAPVPPGGITPYTGCGLDAQLAQDLLNNLGSGGFSTSASCGGNNHALQNIQDMANGLCPSVCADLCSPACAPGGPTGDITVDAAILSALDELKISRGINFVVTSFTTGDHSPTSYHYAGRAVDIYVNSTNSATWTEVRAFLMSKGGTAICEINGKTIPLCDNFSSGVHIHWQR